MSNSFITPQEIAEDLGCNINYVYNLITCEYICSFKLGRVYKIRREWYDDFLNEMATMKQIPGYNELEIQAYKIRQNRRKEVI